MASRVIKAGQASAVKPIEFNPGDTLAETAKRIEQAREEIARFQQAAQEQAKKVLEDAQKQGYEAGYKQGLAQATAKVEAEHKQRLEQELQKRLATLTPALQSTIERLLEARDLWQGEWEKLGIELACAIAARIVHHTAHNQSSDVARQTMIQCLSLVGRCPKVTIYLNPADVESMQLNQDQFDSIFHAIGDVRVVGDPNLTPGGCRVESEFGAIDAAVETQLDRIAAELLGDR